ncbi:hypothetical protein [Streptomyces sp. NPDC059247]|uniref:hypothetical protein n=1 Tax=Streptomyces sp. NPDC059247 TaxID=3346790 RepID=UPI0036B87F88
MPEGPVAHSELAAPTSRFECEEVAEKHDLGCGIIKPDLAPGTPPGRDLGQKADALGKKIDQAQIIGLLT